jgi:hypothetical protein
MGKAQNFSPSSLDGLTSGRVSDPLVPGLCVSVSASGRKTWLFRRRVARSGAIVTLTLGTFPAYTIPSLGHGLQSLTRRSRGRGSSRSKTR